MFHLTPTPCSVHSKQCRKGWADSTGGGREIINSVLPCVLSEVRCGGGSVNCPGSPWNILITGHCWMLGVRFHGEIVPLSPCPGQWTLALVSGDSAANKIGSGSGIVAPGFTSKVSMKYSKTEINIFVELYCEEDQRMKWSPLRLGAAAPCSNAC